MLSLDGGSVLMSAALECADLSALWPKRCQGTALQSGQFEPNHYRVADFS